MQTLPPTTPGILTTAESHKQPSTSDLSCEVGANDNDELTDSSIHTQSDSGAPHVTTDQGVVTSLTAANEPTRRSNRQPKKPRYLKDYEC